MTKIKAIIFDFDGVIAESLDVKTQAFAELYKSYGKEIELKVVQHHLANGGMSRYEKFKVYQTDYLNLSSDAEVIASLADQFSKLVLKKVSQSPSVLGADEFIQAYYNKFDFFISTGTPKSEIDIILKNRDLTRYFKEVYGSPEFKTNHVKTIMKKNGYNKSEVVFIGDATADRDAARANGIEFIGRFTTNAEILKEKYIIKDFIKFNKYLLKL